MLHEFALDPEVMTTWQTVQLLSHLFGVEYGRLISTFPGKWKREVYTACGRRPDLRDIEKARIVEKIKQLDPKLILTGRPYTPTKSWLENAESEHGDRPFRAVISDNNPKKHSFILNSSDLDEKLELWNVPREEKVSRDARAMASCVTLLFQMSRSILFVDPHFKPDAARFRRPLIEFLKVASQASSRAGRPFDRIEYHLAKACDISFFIDVCRQTLLTHIPSGCDITFFRWTPRKPGEDLHPRYILTDVGGIRFERGLDDGEPGETTDVGLLGSRSMRGVGRTFNKSHQAI